MKTNQELQADSIRLQFMIEQEAVLSSRPFRDKTVWRVNVPKAGFTSAGVTIADFCATPQSALEKAMQAYDWPKYQTIKGLES